MAWTRRSWSRAFWWALAAAVVVVAVFLWRPARFFGPDCDELTETMFEAADPYDASAFEVAMAELRDADCGDH